MNDEALMVGLAAVLAGIATVEFVLGFVYSPVLFAIAVPFAAAAYLVWYHASGRLRERVERGRAGSYRRREAETGGFGAGARDSYSGRRGGFGPGERGNRGDRRERGNRGNRTGRGGFGGRDATRAGRGTRADGARVRQNAGPTPSEAYRRLGLDADADFEAVRRAYREKVKEVHPDREGGDEDEFKRVKEAYEVLQDRH